MKQNFSEDEVKDMYADLSAVHALVSFIGDKGVFLRFEDRVEKLAKAREKLEVVLKFLEQER